MISPAPHPSYISHLMRSCRSIVMHCLSLTHTHCPLFSLHMYGGEITVVPKEKGRAGRWADGEVTSPSPSPSPPTHKKECPPLSLVCNAWVSNWTDVPIPNPLHRSNSNFSLACFPVLFLFSPLLPPFCYSPRLLCLCLIDSLAVSFFDTSQTLCVDKKHPPRGNWDSNPLSSFFPVSFFNLWDEKMTDRLLSIPLSLELPVWIPTVTEVQNVVSLFFCLFLLND